MDRYTGKVALVTGASTGIGKSIVEELVKKGMKVVGIARRLDKLKTLGDEMKTYPGKFYPLQCDLTNRDQVIQTMTWIEKNLLTIDVLVNNAAIDINTNLFETTMDDWKKTFDVNMMGLWYFTKEFLALKKKQGAMDNGYIFNINDFRCFKMPMSKDRLMCAPYMASKHALRGFTQGLRMELCLFDSKIKVTTIWPGTVNTEMTKKMFKEQPRLILEPRDISDAIMFAMNTRDTCLVRDMTITPICEM